jgi:membrane protein
MERSGRRAIWNGMTADPKGHRAVSPWQMPPPAWKQIVSRTWQRTWDDNVGLVAAGVAFYGFFSLLSLLAMIVLVYGLVADPSLVIDTMQTLTAVLPSDVASLIGDQLSRAVKSSHGQKGLGLLVAFAVALYGGTNGAGAIITALNIAYEEKEKRSLLRVYAIAIFMTLGAVVLAILALAAVALASSFEEVANASGPIVLVGRFLSYAAIILVAAAVSATLYRFGPSREKARWKWISPGSLFTAVSWLLLTILFGLWVTLVSDYSTTYGSLGATVGLLTWMYLSAYVFVVGAELNGEIEHQTARDSTTGSPEPIGKRGAWAADNVATDDTVQDRPAEVREGERLTQASPSVADLDQRT